MNFLVLLLGPTPWLLIGLCDNTIVDTLPSTNLTKADKDMYVINAMVYQVGILTNQTDKTAINTTGNQESVTFYHTNGSKVDLSKIPEPLLTNVTAQSIVGFAPAATVPENLVQSSAWNTLSHMGSLQPPASLVESGNLEKLQPLYAATEFGKNSKELQAKTVPKRSLDNLSNRVFRRDMNSTVTTPLKIVNGAALIPQDAGVQSIALPPLLTLNNNLSNIPVPIPNTSIVHYAKINTAVRMP